MSVLPLTDKQIEVVVEQIKGLRQAMSSGKLARTESEVKSSNLPKLMFTERTLYEFSEVVDSLLHFKKLAEERGRALEWYADRDNHRIMRRIGGDYAPIVLDKGERARKCLGRSE